MTASLGYQHPDQLEETLATVLNKVIEDKPLEPGEGIIRQQEGVDLLPANIYLAAMEVTLVNIMSRETILREYLNTVRDQYDDNCFFTFNYKIKRWSLYSADGKKFIVTAEFLCSSNGQVRADEPI